MPGPAPDDDRELRLPVDLRGRIGGHDDGFARTDERRGRRLEEEIGTGGRVAIHLHLAHVRVVVRARTQHLSRIAERQLELRPVHRASAAWVELAQRWTSSSTPLALTGSSTTRSPSSAPARLSPSRPRYETRLQGLTSSH